MIDRLIYNFFGGLDNICEWIANKLAGPRCQCKKKRKKKMPRPVRKWIVRLRMWYADIRGHHGKRWNYEPSDHYMRKKK